MVEAEEVSAERALPAAQEGEETRVPVPLLASQAYDSWGCPGAIRGTRGAPACPSYCSRTSVSRHTLTPGGLIVLYCKRQGYALYMTSERCSFFIDLNDNFLFSVLTCKLTYKYIFYKRNR